MTYIYQGGAFQPGVPARDISEAEAKELEKLGIKLDPAIYKKEAAKKAAEVKHG